MSETYYARWYSGESPAVFRLHYDPKVEGVIRAEAWGEGGWVPIDWNTIRGWIDVIPSEELPTGVEP